jgi:hypothetical protein
VALYEMATGTLPLPGKTAARVFARTLHRLPDSSRFPVDRRLIVLKRRLTASWPLVLALLGLFTPVFVEIPQTNL